MTGRHAITFGTDGIRGPSGTFPIDEEGAWRIGRAAGLLSMEGGKPRVLVGQDTRISAPKLSLALGRGMVAAGARPLTLGIAPTSAVGLSIPLHDCGAGVMITASHNPAKDNGFKLFNGDGHKVSGGQLATLEHWMSEALSPQDRNPEELGTPEVISLESYQTTLLHALESCRMDLKGMRIAMDLSNGAMTSMEAWVLENIPAEWVVIGNSAGPINAGCGSENLSALSRTVCESGCIGGFAVDGDGDRCRLVDGGGAEVDGDALAWIFCRHMKLKSLAVTVMSNTALEDTLQGVRIVRTEVGDTYLRAAMDDHSLELGSEQSGHVLFDDFEAGDGLLTGIRAWSSICRSGGDLGAILSDYSPNPRKIYGIEVGAHRPDIAELNEVLEQLWGSPSPLGPGGRVFLRYSGTEPVLRVLVEGRDAHVVDEISKTAYATLTGVLECS